MMHIKSRLRNDTSKLSTDAGNLPELHANLSNSIIQATEILANLHKDIETSTVTSSKGTNKTHTNEIENMSATSKIQRKNILTKSKENNPESTSPTGSSIPSSTDHPSNDLLRMVAAQGSQVCPIPLS